MATQCGDCRLCIPVRDAYARLSLCIRVLTGIIQDASAELLAQHGLIPITALPHIHCVSMLLQNNGMVHQATYSIMSSLSSLASPWQSKPAESLLEQSSAATCHSLSAPTACMGLHPNASWIACAVIRTTDRA